MTTAYERPRSSEIPNRLENEGQLCGDESEVNGSSGGCCGAGGAVSGAAMGPAGFRGAATVPDGRVPRTVVADPPWSPTLGSTWATAVTDKGRPQKHYQTLSLDEIKAHRPETARQAHLWLWCLAQHVDWGHDIARAWGFEPAILLTWRKPGLGVGRFQCNSEHVLLCRKGTRHGNPFGATGGTVFDWPRGRHSEKPAGFFELVERVSPGPYLEMYARRRREGWASWGDQVPDMCQAGSATNYHRLPSAPREDR